TCAWSDARPWTGPEGCPELEPRRDAVARVAPLRATAGGDRVGSDPGIAVPRTARDRARRRDSSRTEKERNSADTGARGRARRSGGAGLHRVDVATGMARGTGGGAERGTHFLDAARNLARRGRSQAFKRGRTAL